MTQRLLASSMPSSSSTATTVTKKIELPVGIFVDLDNVAPTDSKMTRKSIGEWIRPFQKFAKRVGTLDRQNAYGNDSTQLHLPKKTNNNNDNNNEEFAQEWMQPQDFALIYDNEEEEEDLFAYDASMVQTGRDKNGILRCGICGSKMIPNKKERARGMDEFDKLEKHMRTLHDREQAKRFNRLGTKGKNGRKRKVSEKERIQIDKYKAAQVGLKRGKAVRGTIQGKKKNDLFQILKEQGFRCFPCHDVDKELQKGVIRWIQTLKKKKKKQEKKSPVQENTKQTSQQQNEEDDDEDKEDDFDSIVSPPQLSDYKGILVIVSEDSDFCRTLKSSREKGFITVSATSKSVQSQTKKLLNSCDVVLWKHSSNVATVAPEDTILYLAIDDDDDENDKNENDAGMEAIAVTDVGQQLLSSLNKAHF